jgi:hypothetical protein
MARAEIHSGACGYTTTVNTTMNGKVCQIAVESDCTAIQKLAAELTEVEPFKEISPRRQVPKTLEMGLKHCIHSACPVPVGIIKAVEIESGLNLPVDVTIKLSK